MNNKFRNSMGVNYYSQDYSEDLGWKSNYADQFFSLQRSFMALSEAILISIQIKM
jgi:hypothetical protein